MVAASGLTAQCLLTLLDRPIAFHRCFVSVAGSVAGAVFLSQACYWAGRAADPDGWFYKTREQWEEETGLTRREQEAARKALCAARVLVEERRGLPYRLYFRLDLGQLAALTANRTAETNGGPVPTSRYESAQLVGTTSYRLVGTNPPNSKEAETTSETTSETQPAGRPARAPAHAHARGTEPEDPVAAALPETPELLARRFYHDRQAWFETALGPRDRTQLEPLWDRLAWYLARGRAPTAAELDAALADARGYLEGHAGCVPVRTFLTGLDRVLEGTNGRKVERKPRKDRGPDAGGGASGGGREHWTDAERRQWDEWEAQWAAREAQLALEAGES